MMFAMILILLALAIAGLIAAFLLANDQSVVAGFLGIILAFGAGFGAICYSFTVWSFIASEYKTNIINREYGTNYSRQEVFFASDVIDTIRELDRKRIEVNGDLITGKERAK